MSQRTMCDHCHDIIDHKHPYYHVDTVGNNVVQQPRHVVMSIPENIVAPISGDFCSVSCLTMATQNADRNHASRSYARQLGSS